MDAIEIAHKFGWPEALLVMAGGLLLATLRYVKTKIDFVQAAAFDINKDEKGMPKGYIPQLVVTHLQMMKTLEVSILHQEQNIEQQSSTVKAILGIVEEHKNDLHVLIKIHSDRDSIFAQYLAKFSQSAVAQLPPLPLSTPAPSTENPHA